jgi:hypothetical protein
MWGQQVSTDNSGAFAWSWGCGFVGSFSSEEE